MSETDTPDVDPVSNMKAEFDRKLGNIQSQSQSQLEAIQNQLAALNAAVAPRQEAQEPDWQSLEFDPKAAAEAIEQRIEAKMSRRQEEASQAQAAVNSTLGQLLVDFPELGVPSDPMYQQTSIKIGQLKQQSPEAIKAAVYETAMELGVVPHSRRKKSGGSDSDAFSMGSSGSTREVEKRSPKSDVEVSEATKAWSQLLGRDINSESYKAGIQKAASRKNWTRYE